MANALLTGISGLRGHQKMLEVIGNNLANVNTTGFKASRILFSDLVYETTRSGTSGDSQVLGSINPVQIGTGAQVAQIDHKFTQGNLEQSGEELDMAIAGEGFFVVSGGTGENFYTRAGAFTLTESGYLVDSATGYAVQRTGAIGETSVAASDPAFQVPGDDRIVIPKGAVVPGTVTTELDISGNLPATSNGPIAETLQTASAFTTGGGAANATGATLINDLDIVDSAYAAPDNLVIAGNDHDGTPVNVTLAVTATTDVQDLLDRVTSAYPLSSVSLTDGVIQVQANATGPSQLNLQIRDQAGDGGTGESNFASHNFLESAVGQDADSFSKSVEVVDTQGLTHSVNYTLTKTSGADEPSSWDLVATLDSNGGDVLVDSVTGIRFNSNGSYSQVTGTGSDGPSLSFDFGGDEPLVIAVDFGTSGTFNGITEVGAPESVESVTDGYEYSTLTSVQVDADATLFGVTTNGRRFKLAQMAIATFGNPDGLSSAGNNFYQASLASGAPNLGTALTGGRGSIVSQQLEGSNVDLTAEFTRLIIAQRGFSANARTITVTDEVLEELTNLIR